MFKLWVTGNRLQGVSGVGARAGRTRAPQSFGNLLFLSDSAKRISRALPAQLQHVLDKAARLEQNGTFRACSPSGPVRLPSWAASQHFVNLRNKGEPKKVRSSAKGQSTPLRTRGVVRSVSGVRVHEVLRSTGSARPRSSGLPREVRPGLIGAVQVKTAQLGQDSAHLPRAQVHP